MLLKVDLCFRLFADQPRLIVWCWTSDPQMAVKHQGCCRYYGCRQVSITQSCSYFYFFCFSFLRKQRQMQWVLLRNAVSGKRKTPKSTWNFLPNILGGKHRRKEDIKKEINLKISVWRWHVKYISITIWWYSALFGLFLGKRSFFF